MWEFLEVLKTKVTLNLSYLKLSYFSLGMLPREAVWYCIEARNTFTASISFLPNGLAAFLSVPQWQVLVQVELLRPLGPLWSTTEKRDTWKLQLPFLILWLLSWMKSNRWRAWTLWDIQESVLWPLQASCSTFTAFRMRWKRKDGFYHLCNTQPGNLWKIVDFWRAPDEF